MEKRKIYRGEVTSYGYDGEGVLRVGGKVCFVPFVLKDEKISFKIYKETSSFCKGKLEKVEDRSSLRTVPPCPYFGVCGGCTYQHTIYENELNIKKELLKGQLKKVNFDKDILLQQCDAEYGYRNKIKLFVQGESIGLKERGSDKVCDIERCLISNQKINSAIKEIRVFVSAQNLFRDISEIVVRSIGENCLINFIMKKEKEINFQGLYLLLGSNFGIFQSYKGKTEYKIGKKLLQKEEFGLDCEFSINSFHQVNDFVADKLYSEVFSQIKGQRAVNCYSGAGVLSGIIANKKIFVTGIELGKSEHEDAERLKKENNLFYLKNIQGDCSEVLPKLENFDTIIVDPPRSGMDKEVCQAIDSFNSKRLIYISCNSATLVRDLGRLTSFKIESVKMFDMFPRTGEYEVLVVLDKIK